MSSVTPNCTMSNNNDNRGLASADEKTRKRVASEGKSLIKNNILR
jgi:hypothetical protein